jgi:hypothetical protein
VIVLFSIAIALIILHLRRQALTLRALGGMLPICGFCKRIRNGDAWEPLEGFISHHSEAEFSTRFVLSVGRSITETTSSLSLSPSDDRLPGSVRLQVVPQRHRGVVLGIVGAEDQGDRPPVRGLQ